MIGCDLHYYRKKNDKSRALQGYQLYVNAPDGNKYGVEVGPDDTVQDLETHFLRSYAIFGAGNDAMMNKTAPLADLGIGSQSVVGAQIEKIKQIAEMKVDVDNYDLMWDERECNRRQVITWCFVAFLFIVIWLCVLFIAMW